VERRLEGKAAIVTGGVRGLGRAIPERPAAEPSQSRGLGPSSLEKGERTTRSRGPVAGDARLTPRRGEAEPSGFAGLLFSAQGR